MMGMLNNISRRVLICFIIILPFVMVPGLDINTALLISLGFGLSISLWSLSLNMNHLSHILSKKGNK